jgi:large conductance mechanosensitive channel
MNPEEDMVDLSPKDIEKLKIEAENFKKFAFQGNIIQLAVAFILGAAFQKVVTAVSETLIMPIINFALNWLCSTTGTHWRTLTWTPIHGMTFETGAFIGSFVDFLIIAVILYILWIKILHGDTANAPLKPKRPYHHHHKQ